MFLSGSGVLAAPVSRASRRGSSGCRPATSVGDHRSGIDHSQGVGRGEHGAYGRRGFGYPRGTGGVLSAQVRLGTKKKQCSTDRNTG